MFNFCIFLLGCSLVLNVCKGQNRLSDLPESFGNLHSLRYCQLSKNKIELLPSSFGNLSNLEELRLDNNIVRCVSAIWSCVVCCWLIIFTSPSRAVEKYCDEYVCLCVCLSTRYLRNHTRDLYQIFCACCLCPWLGPPPAHHLLAGRG